MRIVGPPPGGPTCLDRLLVEDAGLDGLRRQVEIVAEGITALEPRALVEPDGLGLVHAGLEPENRVPRPSRFVFQALEESRRDTLAAGR